ncbi:c-type cytochrome [Tenacibaculum ovolyticum]|uniref:c-type cytochrome n=1 Tax=Tenacibaculum ovolyticum TaxID=104270 RepID=UPI003BAAD7F0
MRLINVLMIMLITLFVSCGGGEKKDTSNNKKPAKKAAVKKIETKKTTTKKVKEEGIIDLNNKGIGPIKSIELAETIDKAMADKGAKVFKSKCSACHRTNRKFIGPNPTGILKRRSPEWVMNMILNPEEMVKNDPIAKELLMKFNGSPMANQNLSKEETRQVLEFFRTL